MADRSQTPHLRRLLPAEKRTGISSSAAEDQSQSDSSRTRSIPAACNTCRKLKAKCTGGRPSCHRCTQRGILCHYTTHPGETSRQALRRSYQQLQDHCANFEEVFQLMRNLPEEESANILQRIRQGASITTILEQARTGDALLQLALTPETRMRYELPYRTAMPEHLLSDNAYLDSQIYEASLLYLPSQSSRSQRQTSATTKDPSSVEHGAIYHKPFHAARVHEPRLIDAKLSSWTTVCNDDALMRNLAEAFFLCEYRFTAAFHKDFFLDDLVSGCQSCCSSLLVNIILAYACVCCPWLADRADYWNPHTLGYRFLAEAKRLWELECNKALITTIQAGILFNVYHNLCGLDEVGQAYRIQAIKLAQELHLFDTVVAAGDTRMSNCRAYTAWTLYNWETLVAFSFAIHPLLQTPPSMSLPNAIADAQWYGEIWVRYPLHQYLTATCFAQEFHQKCKFRIIMNRYCCLAYSNRSQPALNIRDANAIYVQLKDWYHALPEPLIAQNIVHPGHLQLHMYYHNFVLSLFNPLIDLRATQGDQNPQKLAADAIKHLSTLIRLYYLRHGFEAMDLFIVIPLMLTGVRTVEALSQSASATDIEDLRATLMLVGKGLGSQRRNHYLAQALFRVLRGSMRPTEVRMLGRTLEIDEHDPREAEGLVQEVRSSWPVTVGRNREDLDSYSLNHLVKKYATS